MENSNSNSLYEITKQETSLTLIPKNNFPKRYSFVLIWLTGLEESSEYYFDMFSHSPYLLPHPEKTKIIILCGEKMKITAFKFDEDGDEELHSWFDVCTMFMINENNVDSINFEDVEKSTKRISEVIEKEAQYLQGYNNIYLGGFSQGACMSLHIGLSYPKSLGGIIACSGALFPRTIINKNNENIRIFISHGDLDDRIMKDIHELSIKRIIHLPNIEIHYYPSIGHEIEQQTLTDLNKFFYNYMK